MTTRALIVEDTALLRALLTHALTDEKVADDVSGHANASSAFEAYEALLDEGSEVSLLVIDINLPDETGLSLGRRIRAREESAGKRPAPIVFFSSRAHDDEIDEAIAECFPARYVQKKDESGPEEVAREGAKLIGETLGLKDG
jgi:CheY-like chemotaxis protein